MPDETNTTANPVSMPTPTLPTVAAPDAAAGDVAAGNDVAGNTAVGDAGAVGTITSIPDALGAQVAGVPGTAPNPVVQPTAPAAEEKPAASDPEIPAEVARKIGEAHNVLVALSSDPSVDEMAAAIGLSLYLDKLGKRATAIYSGQTPNALEFLKPEETFEPSVDTLQDFVIALNKEKADHLRYKLDGDYVKIFITPYKSKISEEDLEFSYGDYNVDLVLALDVANGVDLDAALREHGRIMHDAVIINITTGNPGKLGEIEWSDKSASSVSEMIAKLLYSVKSGAKIEKEEATAFLTGIVAATNRFANAGTTSETMRLASRLIDSGANQQLVSKNITPDVENEMLSMGGFGMKAEVNTDADPTKLDIQHGNEEGVDESKIVNGTVTEKESSLLDDLKAAEASLAEAGTEVTPEAGNEPLKIDGATESDDLSGVADAVKQEADHDASVLSEGIVDNNGTVDNGDTASTMPDSTSSLVEPMPSEGDMSEPAASETAVPEPVSSEAGALEPTVLTSESGSEAPEGKSEENPEGRSEIKDGESEESENGFLGNSPEKVIQPPSEMSDPNFMSDDTNKYGQMLENALASADGAAPVMPSGDVPMDGGVADNPAAMGAPAVPTNPEINGVPEMNFMPMPGDSVLPPPPTPPIASVDSVPPVEPVAAANAAVMGGMGTGAMNDASVLPTVEPIQPAAPAAEAAPVIGATPATETLATEAVPAVEVAPEASAVPVVDPGAFKIPGM